jgi:hypothetical protein
MDHYQESTCKTAARLLEAQDEVLLVTLLAYYCMEVCMEIR